MKKIESLEGIRAIACLGIFLCHFKGAFIPQYNGWILQSPLRIMLTGNTIVRILFVLSGFVISYKYFAGTDYEKIPYDIIKRWFRLAPIIIVANLLVHFLMNAKLLYNVEAGQISGSTDFLSVFNNFDPDFAMCIREALFSCYFQGANGYIGPLWTMTYEYLGCILVLAALYICRNCIYLKCAFYAITLLGFSNYYNYFVLGMLLCDVYFNSNISKWLKHNVIANNILFAVSCWTVCMTDINDFIKASRVLWGCAITVMFLTLICSTWGEQVLGNGIAKYIGRLSYAIYVVHWPIIETFSSRLYLHFAEVSYFSHEMEILVNFIFTSVVIWGVAVGLNKYIEPIGSCAILCLDKVINSKNKNVLEVSVNNND